MSAENQPEINLPVELALPTNCFEASSELLFELLKRRPDSPQPMFYFPVWTVERGQRLKDVTLAELQPTGARRQAFRDTFSRAQFKMRLHSVATGAQDERFTWLYTGPRTVDEQPIPDPVTMLQDYGYELFDPATVIADLAQRARATKDYDRLIQASAEFEVPIDRELMSGVSRRVYSLVEEGPAKYGREIFLLLDALASYNEAAVRNVRGQFVSKLLRGMNQPWGQPPADRLNDPHQAAANMLEAAIKHGIIPSDSSLMERILGQGSLYRYDFGVNLAHQALLNRPFKFSANVFGVRRAGFAHDFALSVLDNRIRQPDTPNSPLKDFMRQVLRHSRSQAHMREGTRMFEGLFAMADFAVRDSSRLPIDWDASMYGRHYALVGQATSLLLAATRSRNWRVNEEQRSTEQKIHEILDTVLYPAALQYLARRTVADVVESPES